MTVTASVWAWREPITDHVCLATSDQASAIDYEIGYGLDFYEIVECATGNIVVLGDPADRATTVAALVASYADYYPGGKLIPVRSASGLADLRLVLNRIYSRSDYGGYRTDSPSNRLVVIEEAGFGHADPDPVRSFAASVRGLIADGPAEGWGLIYSADSFGPEFEPIGPDPAPRRVYALGDLTWDRAVGLPRQEITAALWRGVKTVEGIREVIAGAPVDWVTSFEESTVNA